MFIIIIMIFFVLNYEIISKYTSNCKTWHCIINSMSCMFVFFYFYSIIKCSGWFDRECTPRKKTYICSSVEIRTMIIIFAFSLSFSLSSSKREEEEKKIECFKLFHWCMLRVGRTVCCNQQTNIIISRMHIVHEKTRKKKRRNLTWSFLLFFIASSFRMYSFDCLVDDILICLKWWVYWIIYELTRRRFTAVDFNN